MLLGLMGQSGSGKDTAADILVKNFGFIKLALADPMKRVCREIYGFSEQQLWGPSEFRNQPDMRYPTGRGFLSPRVALQTLGTEWGRACYDDTWVNYSINIARAILHEGAHYTPIVGLKKPSFLQKQFGKRIAGVVITDVRFKNELRRIRKESQGYVVRIRRDIATGQVGLQNHPSEEEQKTIPDQELDGVIANNGTLGQLFTEVRSIYRALSTRLPR